jgi:hypothetical protein
MQICSGVSLPFLFRQTLRRSAHELSTPKALNIGNGKDGRFLHISPAGDAWLGGEMFAAKHLATGYLQSIKLSDSDAADERFEEAVEEWCTAASNKTLQAMYDTSEIPESFPSRK